MISKGRRQDVIFLPLEPDRPAPILCLKKTRKDRSSFLDAVTVTGLGFALAMDAFALAAGVGTSLAKATKRQYFRLSWHFGLFQFLMPVLGWLLGSLAVGIVGSAGRWIASAILFILGVKMIR